MKNFKKTLRTSISILVLFLFVSMFSSCASTASRMYEKEYKHWKSHTKGGGKWKDQK